MCPDERAALKQCSFVFAEKRNIVFVVPENLDCSVYLEVIPTAEVKRFDDSYFTGISSYSRLLLTPDFYHCFEEYTYMLIYQLDGWVFRDELDEWCGKEYEYIGAPFFLQDGKKRLPVVGNGGVSLRNIAAMLRVLSAPEKKMFPNKLLWRFFRNYIAQCRYLCCLGPLLKMTGFLSNTRGHFLDSVRRSGLNQEDVVFYFLSREFTADGLLMAPLEEAVLFSLDAAPRLFFREVPAFCHAWRKNDPEFWTKYIKVTENEKSTN